MPSTSNNKRNGLSPESSIKSVGNQRSYAPGMGSSRTTGTPSAHATGSGARTTGRRSYRQSNARRSTSSRAGADIDGFAPIKLIDDQGINRTPKPLVAIVTSAALRQARGVVTEESMMGSESSDVMLGDMLSSTGFSRGWLDSGMQTPLEGESDFQSGRSMFNNAGLGERSLMALSSSSMAAGLYSNRVSHDTSSPSSSARPTGEQAPAAAAATAAAVLTDADLVKEREIMLQETETIFLWELPGLVVAADSTEGSDVSQSNQQFSAQLAARDASDRFTTSTSQTLVTLKKHREVQSGSCSSSEAGCQANRWYMEDSYAALGKSKKEDTDEQLGSVLPSGQSIATGQRSNGYQLGAQTSFLNSSQQNWGRSSTMSSLAGGTSTDHLHGHRRTTTLDSSMSAAWGRRSSSAAGSSGKKSNNFSTDGGTAAAAAALLAVAAAAPQPDSWTKLEDISHALAVMEAAIAQNAYLPQLLLYRDIKPPPSRPSTSVTAPSGSDDGLSASGSLAASASASSMHSSHHLALVPPTPGGNRPLMLPSSKGAAAEAWGAGSHTPHGAIATPSGGGGGLVTPSRMSMSITGTFSAAGMSRRPSQQLPQEGSRQSSFMSMGSSRLMRSNRPPAGLQLLWTWTCATTDGLPITSIAWSSSNTNLVAAGYRHKAPAGAAAADAAASGVKHPGSAAVGSRPVSQGAGPGRPGSSAFARESAIAGGLDSAADEAVADVAGGARGRVALWSLKNQFNPVWTFETKSAVTALDFSKQSPHILAVGLHDGAIAIYDVRSRSEAPLMASTADTGKHSDPVWKVRWIDRGPEREELLVSISTDGKVKAWTIAKGLEHSTLITLKRVPHRSASANPNSSGNAAPTSAGPGLPAGSGAKAAAAAATVAALRNGVGVERDALISRNTGGMSFDFSPVDSRIYLAGTEDGHIHKCSTSYSEQYLESYSGHIGPVYGLQWSPFNPNLFISCSGDWTIRLWQEGRQQQLLSFQSSNEEVVDVQWCPNNSTVFGAVTAGGRLELWDFAVSTLQPVVQHALTKTSMTGLLFAKDAPVVIAANDAGGLQVFRLINIAAERFEPAEMQLTRLDEALRANVMGALSGTG